MLSITTNRRAWYPLFCYRKCHGHIGFRKENTFSARKPKNRSWTSRACTQPSVLPWKLCSAGLVSLVFVQKSDVNPGVCAGNACLWTSRACTQPLVFRKKIFSVRKPMKRQQFPPQKPIARARAPAKKQNRMGLSP